MGEAVNRIEPTMRHIRLVQVLTKTVTTNVPAIENMKSYLVRAGEVVSFQNIVNSYKKR